MVFYLGKGYPGGRLGEVTYPEARFAGSVLSIVPAWTGGPELIRYSSRFEGVSSIRWVSHMLEDGWILVQPD